MIQYLYNKLCQLKDKTYFSQSLKSDGGGQSLGRRWVFKRPTPFFFFFFAFIKRVAPYGINTWY